MFLEPFGRVNPTATGCKHPLKVEIHHKQRCRPCQLTVQRAHVWRPAWHASYLIFHNHDAHDVFGLRTLVTSSLEHHFSPNASTVVVFELFSRCLLSNVHKKMSQQAASVSTWKQLAKTDGTESGHPCFLTNTTTQLHKDITMKMDVNFNKTDKGQWDGADKAGSNFVQTPSVSSHAVQNFQPSVTRVLIKSEWCQQSSLLSFFCCICFFLENGCF